jgi:hypothetical protein
MNLIRISGAAVFLVALAAAPRTVPAQLSFVDEQGHLVVAEARLQKWETELGGTECKGECPDGSNLCCNTRSYEF